ncbi:MAG: HutD family protein [Rhizobiales bacterium]|nr:HutD family protein [Hyphomicrobiales bacterium]
MRKFTAANYRVMPWKNGGGTTTELYVEGSGGAAFLWRVSIADVAADGPFSIFAGYDRHIMAIEGSGMVLNGGPNGPIEVNPKFIPRSFSGDWSIDSRLIAGPVRDFNLMSRRESVESSLACIEVTESLQLGEPDVTAFAHLLQGELEVSGQKFLTGDSLLLTPGEIVRGSSSAARLALCRVKQRG